MRIKTLKSDYLLSPDMVAILLQIKIIYMETITITNNEGESVILTIEKIRSLLFFSEVLFFYMEQDHCIYPRLYKFFESLYPEPSLFWVEYKNKELQDLANTINKKAI